MNHLKMLALSLLLLASLVNVQAQEEKEPPVTLTRTETAGFTFEKIIDLPGVTKEQAYDRMKVWVATNLRTVDNNISFDDKDKNGINTASALVIEKHKITPPCVIGFKISFSFKEGKMKISAGQFTFNQGPTTMPFDHLHHFQKRVANAVYESFDEKYAALIASAEAAASKKDDKW